MYNVVRPLLFKLDPERAHRLTMRATALAGPLARDLARLSRRGSEPLGALNIGGLVVQGPVGLAAGLDKDGELAQFWPAVGFGFVELGTVTALPQPGNPKPRLFRFPAQEAIINRMGFNNHGSEALALKLARLRDGGWRPTVPIGVNIGKSKVTPLEDAVADYALSASRLAEVADYLVVNVSSPNTPGLRTLQNANEVKAIVNGVRRAAPDLPTFVKLAPDMEDEALVDTARVLEAEGASGLIATNTTIERFGIADVGPGGLSGRPLAPRSRDVVRLLCDATSLPVIGVGGVSDVQGALAMLDAGASAIQLYSALVFQGPRLIPRLNAGLAARWAQLVSEQQGEAVVARA